MFCERLKRARMVKGWTTERLAEEVGVSTTLATYWQNGRNHPKIENATRIARALGVSLDWLCDTHRHYLGKDLPYEGYPERLRRSRVAQGLSRAAVERLSKVGKYTVGRVENGDGVPRLDTVIMIANTLDLPMDYVVGIGAHDA